MEIPVSKLHDFVLFLLKDQKFDISEEGIALFDEQYRKVITLLTEHGNQRFADAEAAGAEQVIIYGHICNVKNHT